MNEIPQLKNQILQLGLKIRRHSKATDERVAAIEQRLGIPTPPKPMRLPGESPAPDRGSGE